MFGAVLTMSFMIPCFVITAHQSIQSRIFIFRFRPSIFVSSVS